MKDLRLVASCMRSSVLDPEGNLQRALALADRARSLGADMLLLPEMCLTGYSMSAPFRPMSFDSPEVLAMAEASRGICVCFGFGGADGRIVQAVAEGGRIVGSYAKTHLGATEAERMVPGDSLEPISAAGAVIGIQLCWESHFPEITSTYAVKGADLVLMPHASGLGGDRRAEIWNRILPARAYDCSVFVASCNASGDNGAGTRFGGGAMIIDPKGRVLAETRSGDEDTVCADLDLDILRRIREGDGYRTMRDVHYMSRRRPELYRRARSRISERVVYGRSALLCMPLDFCGPGHRYRLFLRPPPLLLDLGIPK